MVNWISKYIRPKLKSIFKKKSSNLEENLWVNCSCKNLIYKEDLHSNQKVCPKCGEHHKLSCRERFEIFFDDKHFELIDTPKPIDDPLGFEDKKKYTDRLKAARKLTGQNDAVLIATGKVQGIDIVAGAQDFKFIGGSLNAACGESFIAGAQHAIENKIPFVFFSSSGGARMMESMISLSQMSRTTLAVYEMKKKNIPFISVCCEPTTGGVTASYAMLGDIIIAEKNATIGFAGVRVIKDTIREELPENFQKAEWARDEAGQIDIVLERKFLSSCIATFLKVLLKKEEAKAKQEANVTIDKALKSAG